MSAVVRGEELCGLCNSRAATPGTATCPECWASVRVEATTPTRRRRSSASYCACGGGDLHHLCGRPVDIRA